MKKDEILLISSMAINGIIFGSSQLVNPLYLNELGLNSAQIGFLITGQMLIGSFLSLVYASLGDAYGRKKLAIINRGISIFGYFLLFLRFPFGLLIISVMSGGGLISALMAEKSQNLEKNYSLSYSLNTFLSIFGAMLPLFIRLRLVILFNLFILLTSTILISFVKEEYKGSGRVDFRLKSIKNVLKFSIESFVGLGAGLILPIISLWFYLKFGMTASQMSPIFAISNGVLAVSTLFSPKISQYFGKVKSIVYTHIIGIVLLILLPFSKNFYQASIIFIVRNSFMNMTGPIFSSFVMKLIPSEERARAQSLINFLDSIPRSVGPSIGGYFFYLGYLNLPFFITSVLYSIATAGFYILFKDIK
ncbi:Major Facilitator Superfamily transporter [Caldisphaera lagunensis DSM 15908]|uniref:Major Facilitator Superfamily transporter n=1 Tax=Caldisphaera lagunensis (strain DSM 15908 / JCM 11604 / ANMR 0165 / IC-154) TaxID=1056495 RepID=L0AC03_CALLD|nr:MFS transporter [Caldisphaera lagunensis]AFZ70575.1 Major Facilitator Superfamily transporter [Caldisphaera lagunensis DSM 15908]